VAAGLPIEELDEKTLAALGLTTEKFRANRQLDPKLKSLGKVWQAVSKLTNADALWVVRNVERHILNQPEKRGGKRQHTVDNRQ